MSRPLSQRPRNAREAAFYRLLRVEEGAFVGLVDDDAAPGAVARAATEYTAGVTRLRRYLDFLIEHFYRGEAAQLEPALRVVLRIGLYDLLVLGTPPHAALNEAVNLAKRVVRKGAGGLVNGLLRAVLRAGEALPEPATGDALEDLAIRRSHPTWLVRRWAARFGVDLAEALLAWSNARPRFGVRPGGLGADPAAFRAALEALGVAATPSPYLDDYVRVESLQPLVRAGWLRDGRAVVQDEAAALVVRLLDPQPGDVVRDVCAAPGGKALYAAARMGNQGRVLATDLHAGRTRLVARTAAAHGLTAVEAAAADARALEGPPDADRVLLDAPCSGTGVLAKRADLRWQRSPDDLADLARLQDVLLEAAAGRVRPGGLLVYATCSLEPEENDDRVAAFLARRPDYSLEPAHGFVPAALVTPEGFYATFPPRDGVDGAFGARLRRRA